MRRVPLAFAAVLVALVVTVAPRVAAAVPDDDDVWVSGLDARDRFFSADLSWSSPIDAGSFAVSTGFALARTTTIQGSLVRYRVDVIVQIPFERLFTSRPRRPHPLALSRDVLSFISEEELMSSSRNFRAVALLPGALALASVASAKEAAPGPWPKKQIAIATTKAAPEPSASVSASVSASMSASPPAPIADPPKAGRVSVMVSPSLPPLRGATVHAIVVSAWKASGLDRDDVLDSLATRARASALLPELRLRTYRSLTSGVRVYQTDAADHAYDVDGATTFLEMRATFRLDRAVFADEEVAIERIRVERAELKQRVAARVIELALRWQKARRAAVDPTLLDAEREEANIAAVEALVALDALTGGAASVLLLHPNS